MALVARNFVLLLLLAGAVSGQAGDQSQARSSGFRIRGIVINALTGEPVRGAEVAIAPVQNSVGARGMVTGKDGSFDFQKLRPGKYSLEADAYGFRVQAWNQHERFSTAVVVGPNLDSENIQFRLWPDATITGTISDEQNEPVANAQIMLLAAGDESSSIRQIAGAPSDDQGHYRFSHVRAGRFYLAVSAQPWYSDLQRFREPMVSSGDGFSESMGNASSTSEPSAHEPAANRELNVVYPLTYYPGSTDPSGAAAVLIKPGDRAVADVTLAAVPALYLRVREPSPDPSQPLVVNLYQYLVGGLRHPLPTTGRFGKGVVELGGIPPGRFLVTVQRPGNHPTIREKLIDIFADTEMDLSDSSLVPTITGVLLAANGQPLSHPAIVRLSNHSSGQELTVQSSSKGEFEITSGPVDPGKYEVEIEGVRDRLVESVSANGAKAKDSEVEIDAGATVRLAIRLSNRAERVDGTAFGNGKPFAGAMIVLVPEDLENKLSRIRRDQSDSDGTFSLYDVLPGRYTVIALANGWDLDWQSPGVLDLYLQRGATLTVGLSPVPPVKVTVE